MKGLATTFEEDVRASLLDLVFYQWHDLGVPFSTRRDLHSRQVIDPEALIWCSLEFIPTEPRLEEGVRSWLWSHKQYVIRQRLNKLAKTDEPRSAIWHALNIKEPNRQGQPGEPCHGLHEASEILEYCRKLKANDLLQERGAWIGRRAKRPSTVLLQARDLLGNDIRHLLLVYLLANPGGSKLRTIQKWSRYTYRSLSETATRWEAAGVISIDHGFCRLTNPEPWHALLEHHAEEAVIVDWISLFDACIRLLRALAKSGRKNTPLDGPVVTGHRREAAHAVDLAVGPHPRDATLSTERLRTLIAEGVDE